MIVSLVPNALPTGMAAVATAMAFFAAGAVLASWPAGRFVRTAPALVALAAWLIVGMLSIEAGKALAWLVVPYSVVAFGTCSTPVVRAAGRFGDVSYGLYLWGFPVQQLVVSLLGPLAIWLDLLVVVPVALALAVLSWRLVERRALALRSSASATGSGQRGCPGSSGRQIG